MVHGDVRNAVKDRHRQCPLRCGGCARVYWRADQPDPGGVLPAFASRDNRVAGPRPRLAGSVRQNGNEQLVRNGSAPSRFKSTNASALILQRAVQARRISDLTSRDGCWVFERFAAPAFSRAVPVSWVPNAGNRSRKREGHGHCVRCVHGHSDSPAPWRAVAPRERAWAIPRGNADRTRGRSTG